MCGILGFSRSFDPHALSAGLRALAYRGPDDSGRFVYKAARTVRPHLHTEDSSLVPLSARAFLDHLMGEGMAQ